MGSKVKVLSNFLWRFAERCGAQLVQFVVSIILARILAPEVYGSVALITVFTTILNVFVDSGMANALIQKKDADDLDFSTVFYFNMGMCLVLYLVTFFMAPGLALFYKKPELVPVIRVLCLTIVISGLKNVQQAYVSRTMQFKRFFFSTLVGTAGAAVVGIMMAYMGFGIWAMVGQQLLNTCIDTFVLWITVKWRPKKMFSFERLKSLFSFGWKLLVSALLDTVYNNLRQLLIGRFYSSTDLAYFNRGKQFPYLIITNINTSIDSVLLPAMSREQDDVSRVRTMTMRAIKTSTYIMSPMMVGLVVCSEPLVRLLLTEKWMECVPYMRIFCIAFIFYPIHTANLNAMKALGRSDLFLKLEIIKKILGVVVILCTVWHGTLIMAYSLLIECLVSIVINSWPNRKLLNYSFAEQMLDILPGFVLSIIMGSVIYPILLLHLSDFLSIVFMFFVGLLVYLIGSIVFRLDSFYYLIGIIQSFRKR